MAIGNIITLKKLTRVVDEFRVIAPDFPMSYASVFLYIAQHSQVRGELPSVNDVADATGISRPAMSRVLLSMGDRGRGRAAGSSKAVKTALKLIERHPDAHDLRMVRYGLTAKGQGLMKRLELALD